MPYQIRQLIEDQGAPVCVRKDETVPKALSLMIEHDYSQLPVIETVDSMDIPQGMITYEGILRGVRNFRAKLDDLMVHNVMVDAPIYNYEDDLFDILDRLKDTNAILVTEVNAPALVGIITSYDMTQYFRDRTEDLMRVEEIELMIKEFIQAAYTEDDGELNEIKLNAAIARVIPNTNKESTGIEKGKTFDELTLSDYNSLLLMPDTWPFLEPILGIQREFARPLLNGIRDTRNALAHFRSDDITPEQRDQLNFAAQWLTRCQQEYQDKLEAERQKQEQEDFSTVIEPESTPARLREIATTGQVIPSETAVDINNGHSVPTMLSVPLQPGSDEYIVTESASGGGRWAAFADWLQSQRGSVDNIPLTFNQIEEIIKSPLPASARQYRAWWANDTVSHTQSQQWLEAGWRTTYINLTEGRVTFSRIREREKAYISFFSNLLDDLHKASKMSVREVSPDGVSWIVINTLPRRGGQDGAFNYAFSRDRRLRVELYLDLGDQARTKATFDRLLAQKDEIEAQTGPIEWERLDNRRASRLAQYHDGQITDDSNHAELRQWAVDTMIKFYNTLAAPAEKAILEAKRA